MAKKLSTAMLTALSIAHSQGEVLVGDDQRVALLGMAGRVSSNTITALHSADLLRRTRDSLAYELTIDGLRALAYAGIISAEEYAETRAKRTARMDALHAEALELDERRAVVRAYLCCSDDDELTWPEIERGYELYQARSLDAAMNTFRVDAGAIKPKNDELEQLHAEALEMDAQRTAYREWAGLDESHPTYWTAVAAFVEHTKLSAALDDVAADGPQSGDTYSRSLRHGAEVVRVDEVRAGNVWYRFAQGKGLGLSAPYSLRLDRFVERYSRVPA